MSSMEIPIPNALSENMVAPTDIVCLPGKVYIFLDPQINVLFSTAVLDLLGSSRASRPPVASHSSPTPCPSTVTSLFPVPLFICNPFSDRHSPKYSNQKINDVVTESSYHLYDHDNNDCNSDINIVGSDGNDSITITIIQRFVFFGGIHNSKQNKCYDLYHETYVMLEEQVQGVALPIDVTFQNGSLERAEIAGSGHVGSRKQENKMQEQKTLP
ncbi:unnamed protein product [Onchocerca flexuosa]|uniref:Tify domain-containing protein n=1 Tax=Onchocerca flexuosa TaxID=387005 RepID=A0A183H1I6_9BILA|nr:unnamed protein product [Onchocerca flexuosa]